MVSLGPACKVRAAAVANQPEQVQANRSGAHLEHLCESDLQGTGGQARRVVSGRVPVAPPRDHAMQQPHGRARHPALTLTAWVPRCCSAMVLAAAVWMEEGLFGARERPGMSDADRRESRMQWDRFCSPSPLGGTHRTCRRRRLLWNDGCAAHMLQDVVVLMVQAPLQLAWQQRVVQRGHVAVHLKAVRLCLMERAWRSRRCFTSHLP